MIRIWLYNREILLGFSLIMIFIYDFSTLQFYNYQAFSKKLTDQYNELKVVIKATSKYCIVKYIDKLLPNSNTGL